MLDYLRLRFLRFLGIISLFSIIVSMITDFLDISKGNIVINVVFVITIIVSMVVSYALPPKRWMFFIIPVIAMGAYIVLTPIQINAIGRMMPFGYFLFPVYTFFLVGVGWGLIFSIILFVAILINLGIHSFDMNLLGSAGTNFLLFYVLEVAILFALEWVHSFMFREIKQKTYTDDLTGLLNRSGILLELDALIKKDRKFFFIMTDFDHFSHINANLGHELSDNIIHEAAGIFKDDKKVHAISRWYGDQFGIIFVGSEDDLFNYLKTRQRLIRTLSDELNIEVEISFSCGITSFVEHGIDQNDIVPFTEIALAEAKKSDRAMYHVFEKENLSERNRQLRIERDILEALKSEEIQVHFQPKISVQSGLITGMEALVRWNHPELGFIAPPEFIEIAEKNGDIVKLGEYVIHNSLSHLKRCQIESNTNLTVSINISPLHLLHSKFILFMNEAVLEHGINPENVYLEITENVMLQKDLVEHLEMIQRLGFKLSLDDFGTGYSSLNYLHQFNFDELKIDKCFTDGLLRGEKEVVLFKTILEIARNFKMKSVIEGLEDEKQLRLVQQMSADEIQGWYYSKALAPDEFIAYLKMRNTPQF